MPASPSLLLWNPVSIQQNPAALNAQINALNNIGAGISNAGTELKNLGNLGFENAKNAAEISKWQEEINKDKQNLQVQTLLSDPEFASWYQEGLANSSKGIEELLSFSKDLRSRLSNNPAAYDALIKAGTEIFKLGNEDRETKANIQARLADTLNTQLSLQEKQQKAGEQEATTKFFKAWTENPDKYAGTLEDLTGTDEEKRVAALQKLQQEFGWQLPATAFDTVSKLKTLMPTSTLSTDLLKQNTDAFMSNFTKGLSLSTLPGTDIINTQDLLNLFAEGLANGEAPKGINKEDWNKMKNDFFFNNTAQEYLKDLGTGKSSLLSADLAKYLLAHYLTPSTVFSDYTDDKGRDYDFESSDYEKALKVFNRTLKENEKLFRVLDPKTGYAAEVKKFVNNTAEQALNSWSQKKSLKNLNDIVDDPAFKKRIQDLAKSYGLDPETTTMLIDNTLNALKGENSYFQFAFKKGPYDPNLDSKAPKVPTIN